MSINEETLVVQDKETKKGRKRIELDREQIQRLASIQCTLKEMAYIMNTSIDTLRRNYLDDIELGKATGRLQLRRAQWRNAVEKDNVTMQIWLGKNILNQTDQPVDEDSSQILPWND